MTATSASAARTSIIRRFLYHDGLTLDISGPPSGTQRTHENLASAAPVHVVVRPRPDSVVCSRTAPVACRRQPRRAASTAALAPPKAAALAHAITTATASAAWRGGPSRSSIAARLPASMGLPVAGFQLRSQGLTPAFREAARGTHLTYEKCASRPSLQRLVRQPSPAGLATASASYTLTP